MTISNGYCTLVEFKQSLRSTGLSTESNDDSFIEEIIERSSRYIDTATQRHFYAQTATKYLDLPVPASRKLNLPDDLLTVTTLTNGDGVVLTTADYYLHPRNEIAKYAVVLKESSVYSWQPDADSNTENAITLVGTWGYVSQAATDDQSAIVLEAVKLATIGLAMNVYKSRAGVSTDGVAEVTAAGLVITPRDVPATTAHFIKMYKRVL